jgi:hypothetical protein
MIDNVLLSRKLLLLPKLTASAGGFELAACSCPEDHIRQGRVAVGKSITLDSIDRVILFSFAGILQVGKKKIHLASDFRLRLAGLFRSMGTFLFDKPHRLHVRSDLFEAKI